MYWIITFTGNETVKDTTAIRKLLSDYRLDTRFQDLFEVKTGYIHTTGDIRHTVHLESVMDALREMPPSQDKDVLLSNLFFALIVPDEIFEYYTQGTYDVYLNGILAADETEGTSLMSAISNMNQELRKTGLSYESYLQNMARQLFYMVSASYITIYLAIIFLIIANTIIGVQFLMTQQKAGRRYRTLIHLGADEYLTKPCRKERLLARVSNVLKRYEGRHNPLEGPDFLLDRQTYTLYIHNSTRFFFMRG